MNVPKPLKKCTKSSLSRRFFPADMDIVQFLKLKLQFKCFCKLLQREYQMDKSSIEHTKLTGTHAEKEVGFQLAENLGIKKDLSLTKNKGLGCNIVSCSELLDY